MSSSPRKHRFIEVMPREGYDAFELNKAVAEAEAVGDEFVSVSVAPETKNWVVCFRLPVSDPTE